MFRFSVLKHGVLNLFIASVLATTVPAFGFATSQQDRAARRFSLRPAEARRIIAQRTRGVISALQRRDMRRLATFVHPTRGVRFSPSPSVSPSDAILTRGELVSAWRDRRPDVWGETEAGEINVTFQQYFAEYVYARDFARVRQVSYNRPRSHGNNSNTLRDNYPQAILVEYHSPGRDPRFDGMDWQSLWLVFERAGRDWYLVGIAHDEWAI
ncbi:MAG: hypothetical protein M3371_10775 [Acidobacteriota bacterium]|nr:hypothetical protein [Acidobacteriota bacterium]